MYWKFIDNVLVLIDLVSDKWLAIWDGIKFVWLIV